MKKSLFALAVLGAFSGMAAAQSSVTLFGVVDAAATYVKNDNVDQKKLTSGANSTSRLGFRGVEDLGGGLKAGFWLETHVGVDDGTQNSSGKFWHRRATVSLSGDFGEVRIGRDTTPTWNAFVDYDPFGTVGVGDRSRTGYGDTFKTAAGNVIINSTRVRADNMVSYFLPSSLGGFYGQLSVAAGEGANSQASATTPSSARYVGGRLGYKAGPLDLSAAYGKTELTSDRDFDVVILSGAYDFGVARALASYQRAKADGAVSDLKKDYWMLGLTAPVGPGTVKFSYNRVHDKSDGANERNAHSLNLGYVYDLSKRTALYGTVAYLKNKDQGDETVSSISGATMGLGKSSRGFDVGIRHSF